MRGWGDVVLARRISDGRDNVLSSSALGESALTGAVLVLVNDVKRGRMYESVEGCGVGGGGGEGGRGGGNHLCIERRTRSEVT